jgi:type I restriction enzyme S subunit
MSKTWPVVKLGEVLTSVSRPIDVQADEQYRQIGIRSHGKGVFHKEPVSGFDLGNKKVFWVEPGDFVLNIVFAWEGAVAIMSNAEAGMIGSHRFPCFRPTESRLDSRFLLSYFKTPSGLDLLGRISPGGAGRNRTLSRKAFLEQSIPLPSLSEQRRIVARIEALTGEIHEAKRLRKEAEEEADALVSSTLTHLQLPCGTQIEPISQCSSMSTGTTPSSHRTDYYGGPIQWYTPGDLSHQQRLGSSSRTLSDVAVLERKARIFVPGTILLVAIGGSLGKVALTHEFCSANQQITGIKFFENVLPEYGFWWMRRLGKELMAAAPQATLPIINQARIGVFEIGIPPLPEQRCIVAELDAMQAKVDSLKRLQAETAAELDALLPSILDRAFKGEL